mmetsp:Transcript_10325/g.34174  ORF Transcript_10325/g.34174 Transcript_10325/m.34174 type:complete len:209 (-) Transcript_10325:1770-2396(-)
MSKSLRVMTPTTVGHDSTTSRWRRPSARKRCDTRRSDEFWVVTRAASLTYGRRSIVRSSSAGDMRIKSCETISLNHGRKKSSAVRVSEVRGTGSRVPARAPGGGLQLCAFFLARMVTSCSRRIMPRTRGLRSKKGRPSGKVALSCDGEADRSSCDLATTGKPWWVVVLSRSRSLPTRSTSLMVRMPDDMTCLACRRSRRWGGSSGSIG